MSKTLYELVQQYKSDVETRIQCLRLGYDELDFEAPAEQIKSIEEQIAHWEATLAEIDETLNKVNL